MENNKKIITGGLRERLKARLKEIIRKQLQKEMTTSSAVGGGEGSAGPIKTPHAFGKSSKNPTQGLDGYNVVGEKKDAPSSDDYQPITKKKDKGDETEKRLKVAGAALDTAKKELDKVKKEKTSKK